MILLNNLVQFAIPVTSPEAPKEYFVFAGMYFFRGYMYLNGGYTLE